MDHGAREHSAPDLLSGLAEMAVTSELLAGSEDLSDTLQRLAHRAREVTGADFAAISTFDETGIMTRFIYAGISEDQARRLGDPPRGRGLLGELAERDRPFRLADVQAYSGYTGWPAGHPDMCAFLGAPIRANGRTIGSLYMTRDRGREPFSEAEESAAAVLALQGAVSLATGLARERRGRLYVLEERGRIAHDLHDGTIQALYAIGLECDSLSNREDFPGEAREAFAAAVTRINDLIADMRGYIFMLETGTPAAEPELTRDLAFVIRQIVSPAIASVVNISAAALQELSAREAEDLLYIAREALSNSVRHGAPSKVAIDLRQSEDATILTVQDNGVGFDLATVRRGLGRVTMQTRADRLGATLTLIGIPGMGATVRVSIPRHKPAEDDDE
ncbi:MAG: GAF domain-containing protein [Dehalococcoidia bacterium]|uniref:GAF domain-containing sensor histidine kinase n=1 Tax=Candidatus Amarobacter glycogenicus TaxID=3140699 RepID=UPI003135344B|nr:GAF domain-containing protein [Dehalococcoidia bacterium]MBK6562701.1 GAF domain-containing protein [Dehalococcoidia bacterium]MBK7126508.1 GAF domain-containing protein [Dehalococcoidia bacterium]MBK7329601.1 GAF domain-containing protein [Dehalococcoidia bacterium]MBK8560874.1 GAF domain-containing protein [Dehalococcoidia bacterium]